MKMFFSCKGEDGHTQFRLLLLSDLRDRVDAASFIVGHALPVDGGYTVQ